ncbi:hypothetical protein [Myceligenerans crystallogenes]|uniref:Uncharacterized protein n=1 Tax=Myceligenerans crystallogenes TaxID=316335 RepID=A0ABN2N300_9MICO
MLVVAVGAPAGVHSGVHRADRTLDSVVAAVRRLPADDVVLVTRDDEARLVARSARLVLGSERLAHLHLAGARLTAWALVLAGLSTPALPASSASAVADDVLANVHTRAILSTVASLGDPVPTFRQHAGSLLPNSAFLVDTRRGTVGRFQGRLGLPEGELLAVARSPRPVVPEATIPGLLPRTADADLGPQPARPASWPAPRWFEASVLLTPLTATITGVATGFLRWPSCEVCGRATPAACLFCGVGGPDTVAAPAAATTPSPASDPQEQVR